MREGTLIFFLLVERELSRVILSFTKITCTIKLKIITYCFIYLTRIARNFQYILNKISIYMVEIKFEIIILWDLLEIILLL